MPNAARLGDTTNHGGTVVGPGVATVLIGGMPAAVMGDNHVCPIPAAAPHLPVSPFLIGSTSVFISGRPAIRAGDMALCGASVVVGAPTVQIG
jgi:uncharacterized Zn-binding protein involved in type VI secretion